MKRIFFFALAAALCLVSCNKDPLADENSNWWYRSQLGPKGVKSITDQWGGKTTFNQNGTIASETGGGYEATFKYSKDGLLTESTTVETYDGKTITTTYKFEYNNKGKFIPRPMNPGFIFHVFEMGLVPDLSKVIIKSSDYGDCVMEYTFNGDKMTMTTTGGPYGPYDPVVVEYKGKYPYHCENDMEFFGPITYQENGMFDTYKEGFITDGKVSTDRTFYVKKGLNDMMLTEKMVDVSWGETSTDTYTYNEHGDQILSESESSYGKSKATTTYEYDSHGNWIKADWQMSSYNKITDKWEEVNKSTQTRTIEYY